MVRIFNKKLENPVIFYILIAVLSAAVFFAVYGSSVLDPCYEDWLLDHGDLTHNYLGWKAFRNTDWTFPLGMTDQLIYPERISIIYTDSIPLFAIIFKLFSFILPKTFQYFGLWGLLCYILQGVFTAVILSRFTDNKILVIPGTLLLVISPALFFRMYFHAVLSAHWLILFALIPLLDRNSSCRKLLVFSFLLGFLSASIHIYFLLEIGFIILGYCIKCFILTKKYRKVFTILGAYIITAVLTVWVLGGFQVSGMGDTFGLGAYSFNLNGFLNPQGYSSFLHTLPLYTGGQYEGFSYLGAGMFLLIIIDLAMLLKKRTALFDIAASKDTCLIFAVIIFFSVFTALSPLATFNHQVVYKIKLPGFIEKLWSLFRSSGRLIWPAYYLIGLCVLILFLKSWRGKLPVLILSLSLLMQLLDCQSLIRLKYREIHNPVVFTSSLQNEFWHQVPQKTKISHVVFPERELPKIGHNTFSILNWAFENHLTVNTFPLSHSFENDQSFEKKTLSDMSGDCLYFLSEKEASVCDNANLYCYDIDGVIVGLAAPLEEFADYIYQDNDYFWKFGNHQYLHSGEDTVEGRVLYSGGFSYGPYWKVTAGRKIVTIYGENMNNIGIKVQADSGNTEIGFEVKNAAPDEVIFELDLNEMAEDLEIVLNNYNEDNMLIKEMTLSRYKLE